MSYYEFYRHQQPYPDEGKEESGGSRGGSRPEEEKATGGGGGDDQALRMVSHVGVVSPDHADVMFFEVESSSSPGTSTGKQQRDHHQQESPKSTGDNTPYHVEFLRGGGGGLVAAGSPEELLFLRCECGLPVVQVDGPELFERVGINFDVPPLPESLVVMATEDRHKCLTRGWTLARLLERFQNLPPSRPEKEEEDGWDFLRYYRQ